MKRRARVKKGRKIGRLSASADENAAQDAAQPEARRFYKPLKKRVTVRLDADVLAWFKKQGRGYQTRINRALSAWIREQKTEQKRRSEE
jgi:uncharacterized protein (DUF4415 family)